MLKTTGCSATIDFGQGPVRLGHVHFGPSREEIYRARLGRLPGSARTSRLRKKRDKLVRERLLPDPSLCGGDRWHMDAIDAMSLGITFATRPDRLVIDELGGPKSPYKT